MHSSKHLQDISILFMPCLSRVRCLPQGWSGCVFLWQSSQQKQFKGRLNLDQCCRELGDFFKVEGVVSRAADIIVWQAVGMGIQHSAGFPSPLLPPRAQAIGMIWGFLVWRHLQSTVRLTSLLGDSNLSQVIMKMSHQDRFSPPMTN